MIKLPSRVGAVSLAILLVAAVATPTVAARAALFNQVNDALTFGGFALTHENWLPFADGVVKGHYKNLDQLKGAAKFHKVNGTLPDRSKFGTAVAKIASSTGAAKCRTGNVLSLSSRRITISAPGKNVGLSITAAQKKIIDGRSIKLGSQVKVCSKNNWKTLAGNATKLGTGNENNDDGGGGGGGGSSSSSGT